MNKKCKGLTFEECELTILRSAVDKADESIKKKRISSPEIKDIINIVETFIRKRRLLCYGGTAINNILPKEKQFYNKDIDIADYDFFSPNALQDAKDLANIYYDAGYTEVEAKSGIHYGTFKVFVNFMPIADITMMDKELFKNIKQDAIESEKILYCPPDYLRMAMYLELSRPEGDIGRWEKVLKRLSLLNDEYPISNTTCDKIDIQRDLYSKTIDKIELYEVLKSIFIKQGLVFFGGYANSLYSEYLPDNHKKHVSKIPDFDLLSENPSKSAKETIAGLKEYGFKNAKYIKHDGLGEIIAPHYEIIVSGDTVAFIYEPIACHSYNIAKIDGTAIKIASIDTMLSFYLAFIYANRPYYNKNRIMCMANNLFVVQERNKLSQKGILKRFSLQCYGKQLTMEDMRAEKSAMFKILKNDKKSKEYQMWFLRYIPGELIEKIPKIKSCKNNKKTKNNKTRKNNNGNNKSNKGNNKNNKSNKNNNNVRNNYKNNNSNRFGSIEL